MSRIPPHIIDEIMNTARIEEVIGEYVQLKKAGANYKGLSPFSEERTPSFVVSPAKQIFKDFSSGKGGTVVSFLMEIEQFSYPESLRWLAERYNIIVPADKPLTAEEAAELTERESLQIVNQFAKDFFVSSLSETKEGKAIGLSYFKERGFKAETIAKFQLGYCPRDEKSLTETAIENGYKSEYLETLGLTKRHENRRFDFFSGRVIFPIHSVSGKVLGFGGRTLRTDKNIAKYFNSPESILYDKSKTLYGIYFAKKEIIKHDQCFLVEGYTDVISLAQAGVDNVVSSSGTALTKGQIKLIQRYTQNITILYDSDEAGIRASFRGIDMLLEEGMNVKILLFPDGEDPDSYARKVSTETLKTYLAENEEDFVGFKTKVLMRGMGNDPIKRTELIKEIIQSIAVIPDAITRSVYIKETASQFEMEEQTLLNELNKIRRSNLYKQEKSAFQRSEEPPLPDVSVQIVQKPEKKGVFYEQEMDLLRVLLLFGDRAIEIKEAESNSEGDDDIFEISVAELIIAELERDQLNFYNQLFKEIYEIYKKALEENYFYDPLLFLRNKNIEIVQFVTDILTPRHELSENWLKKYNIETTEEKHKVSQMVKETLYSFKNSVIMRQIENLQERLKSHPELEKEETNKILKEIILLGNIKRAFLQQLGRIV